MSELVNVFKGEVEFQLETLLNEEKEIDKEVLQNCHDKLVNKIATKLENDEIFWDFIGNRIRDLILDDLENENTIWVQKLKEAHDNGELPYCEEIDRLARKFGEDIVDDNGNFFYEVSLDAMWSAMRMAQLEEWNGQTWDIYRNIQHYLMYNAIGLTSEDITYIEGE